MQNLILNLQKKVVMNLYYIFHTILAQKGANAIKIVSVAVGLLVSCIIFTYLARLYGYNSCYKDSKNLYIVQTSMDFGGREQGPMNSANALLSEAVIEELPDDVRATSFADFYDVSFHNGDAVHNGDVVFADTMIFEVLGLGLLTGYPKEDMKVPGVVYLSRSFAKEIFGDTDAVGKSLRYTDDFGGEMSVVIKGIYKDVPDNVTEGPFKAIISLPTETLVHKNSSRLTWDIVGGCNVYVHILPESNLSSEALASKLNEIQERNRPNEGQVMKVKYSVIKVGDVIFSFSNIKNTLVIMWVLGFSLLFITTFNYSLITIASLSRRAKAIGVHKCVGASQFNIVTMFLSETLLILVISTALMIVLLFTFQPILENVSKLKVEHIFSPNWMWASGTVLLFFFLIGGLLPGLLFSKISATQVFRRFTDKNGAWKRNLLFIQLTGLTFVGGILAVVASQFRELMTHDMGFVLDDKVIIHNVENGLLKSAVSSLPYVKTIGDASGAPMIGHATRSLKSPNGDDIGIAFTQYKPGFLEMMNFHLLKGRYPEKEGEILVNEKFCEVWNLGDSILGREVNDGHEVIVGVLQDYYQEGFTSEIQPAIMELTNMGYGSGGIVQLNDPFNENFEKLKIFLEETFPTNKLYIRSGKEIMESEYSDLKMARDSAGVAMVALILIVMMGLVGFTRDEVERRRKEIAIRKVNGAALSDILMIICGDTLKICVPAVIIGVIAAWYVSPILINNFTVIVPHLTLYYIATGFAVLMAVLICVMIVSYRVANENPINYLKSE